MADIEATKPQPLKPPTPEPTRSSSRSAKKALGGHFSPELSRAVNLMAVEEEKTVQALLGEALDLLMKSRGKHPFGER